MLSGSPGENWTSVLSHGPCDQGATTVSILLTWGCGAASCLPWHTQQGGEEERCVSWVQKAGS